MLPPKPQPKHRNNEEYSEQSKLILLIRNELAPKYPILLRWLHSIPNGLFLHKSVATKMINEGSKAGVADLFLPVQSVETIAKTFPISQSQKQLLNLNLDKIEVLVPRYSGLYLEMKSKEGTHKQKQKEFANDVRQQGFKVVVPRSCDEALNEILFYCGIEL